MHSLGDRHGENLSFEEGTGGLLHVDFNCLFDKGQTFEKPEVVPFRLTHNMIDAFGAYGYNGRLPFFFSEISSRFTLKLISKVQVPSEGLVKSRLACCDKMRTP
jgi:phosphatidylinositol kinase/protein kinase (PI-3  family)